MSGGGRSRRGDDGPHEAHDEGKGERFADRVGDDVVPLRDRDAHQGPPAPPRHPSPAMRPPERAPVRFVSDAEGQGRAEDVSVRILAQLSRGDPAPERELDLHGMDARAAEDRVRRAILAARAEGARCLLVIHGRGRRSPGEAVLRRGLPEWLARPPLDRIVMAWCRAPERMGGAGASLVRLRRDRQRDAPSAR